MKAFVLAGGLGTRLRPRFGDLPKALAPLAGRPFIEHLLAWLAAAGVREAVLCAGHGAEAVHAALGDACCGVRIAYSIEPEPLGTGGALALAAQHVTGPALVVNGDTLPECDPWTLEHARWTLGAIGAIALFEVDDAGSRGCVEVDAAGRVVRFVEKDANVRGRQWVNGGLYAFSPVLWRHLPGGESSLERDVLPALATAGRLVGERMDGTFWDIGTPDDFARAERRFAQ